MSNDLTGNIIEQIYECISNNSSSLNYVSSKKLLLYLLQVYDKKSIFQLNEKIIEDIRALMNMQEELEKIITPLYGKIENNPPINIIKKDRLGDNLNFKKFN